MGYPPLEELLPKSNYSIYKLVRLASTRATELADGKQKLISSPTVDKAATIALEEIQAGKVVLKGVEEKVLQEFAEKKKKAEQDLLEEEVENV